MCIIGWQTQVPQEDLDRVYTPEEQAAFYRVSGWPLEHGMPAANLAWIKLHKPEILARTRFLAMSTEYLNYLLTGRWGLSHSMGTPFFLIVQETGEYNVPLLAKFGLTPEQVPPVYDKGTVLGTVKPEMARKLGKAIELLNKEKARLTKFVEGRLKLAKEKELELEKER